MPRDGVTVNHRRNQNSFTRRDFLKAGALTLVPPSVFASVNSNPDVVIIGAGAAGLAAAHTLLRDNRTVVIVEGNNRVGGRTYTDHSMFGVPFDVGAHWLHNGRGNPYNVLARKFGFDVNPAPEVYRLFADGQEVDASEVDKLWELGSEMEAAIGKLADAGKDVSLAEAVAHFTGQWSNLAKFVMGPWGMAKDLKDISTVDWWNSENGDDFFCRQGLGTVVEHYAKDLPISLNTKVERVNWSGEDVIVETTQGTLRAKAVIVTASTGVLASDSIKFAPELPLDKIESFNAISMGSYDHIALRFSEDVFEMGEDGYLMFDIGDDGRGFGTLTNTSGTGIAYCDVGGDWARELTNELEDVKVNYALDQLESLLGSSVKRSFILGTATQWNLNQWSLGAYASAEPGAYAMRAVLRRPVGEKVFFAGEACHRALWATIGGAHLSGAEVGRVVSSVLD